MSSLISPGLLLGGSLALLLAACGQAPSSTGEVVSPWVYAAPAGKLTSLSLTPGENNLYFEPILAARNAWGPIEIDRSNGEQQAGDGQAITLNGITYARGFGTHAGSELRFSLKGTGASCSYFIAEIGVDDEVGNRGSVIFQVYLDGMKAYDSGVMTGASATKRPNLNIKGKQELRLVVTDAGNGISSDHADWAVPRIYCAAITAPGSIDPRYGQDGKTLTDFGVTDGAGFSATDWPRSAVVDQEGRALVIGDILFPREAYIGAALARYTRGGLLDASFGEGGKLIWRDFTPTQILTDAQNRVLVLGEGGEVRRLTVAGNPDQGFGTAGKGSPLAPGLLAYGMALDGQGRLTVLARQGTGLVLERYTADGSPDPGFGQGGLVRQTLPGPLYDFVSARLVMDRAGRVIAASTVTLAAGQTTVLLQRYTLTGVPDRSFGQNGSVDAQFAFLSGLGLTPGDHLLVMGGVTQEVSSMGLRQYTPGGSLDTAFGAGGLRNAPLLECGSDSLAVDPQGRLLLTCNNTILRLRADGRADPSFGTDGVGRVEFTGGLTLILMGLDAHYIGVGPSTSVYETPAPDFSLAWYFGQ